jgi:bacteriocin biosynthesis cyclodehydratase domain-containing protein
VIDGPAASIPPSPTTIRLVEASNHLVGFRRHLHAEVVPGEAVYLFSEKGVTALAGRHIEALAPLLDGTRDLPTLLRDLPTGTPPRLATELIVRLTSAGLVTTRSEPAASFDQQSLAYWDASGLDPATAVANLFRTQLALITVGSVDREAAAKALRATGLTVTTDPAEPADLSVVLCSDYLDPELHQIDTTHRAAGRPWLVARPVGSTIWVGPIFQPPSPGCWTCLAARLSKHRMAEEYVQRTLGRAGPAPRCVASVPQLTAMAMHLVSLEASKWLSGYRYAGQSSVWTFDSLELQGRHHELRARPQCSDCGDPELVARKSRQPVVLTARRKARGGNGGYRSMPPQQVLDRYRHLVSPVTGVLKEIGRDQRGPAFFNSFRSGTDLPSGPRSLRSLNSAMKVENGGKGVTALDAEVSARCEALERHSGNFQGDEERIRGSLRSLGERALHPNTYQLFHERQFSGREAWNAAHSPFQYVCMPFDEDAAIDWTPVWSLTRGCHRLLPTSLLYFGAPVRAGARYGRADSNGNAAGASLEDAVLQGLLELIERDAVSLWWYNRTRYPAVDLDSFGDPWVIELREVYRELGREVWALDLTSDLRVPAVAALSRQVDGPSERIMFGFGAHLDPAVALRRALTEMNQLTPSVLDDDRTGRHGWDHDPDAAHWLDHATIANQPYLLPDPAAQPMRPGRAARFERTDDIAADVRSIQATIEAAGLELLVLDQTRPDIGLPVVKVIVPGLRHFWARYAPGRLYDVPVRLGLCSAPTPYAELNPIPLFV